MKKILFVVLCVGMSTMTSAQILNDLKKSAEKAVNGDEQVTKSDLTKEEVTKGLKEALGKGAEFAVRSASRKGGFNQNPLIRIPFPEEAKAAKDVALKAGLDDQVEKFETTMNRAAEKASAEAVDILKEAVVNMTVEDAFAILNGTDTAATHYLRTQTMSQLTERFKPIVSKSIDEVNLTKYWEPIISTYNKNPFKKEKVNPDLDAYVTQKALDGLFTMIKKEEKNIRINPKARATEILQKVFGS
ncbi:DUF4197 domain-containing protein [Salibacter halophilus]|nr:DUF4197 domain-containing protein [Salibacter halophilus]